MEGAPMRSCGECSACCRLPEIAEIGKPASTPCKHLCPIGHGCKIYEGRPSTCSNYECAWLLGHGANADRPDRSGVLIELRQMRRGDGLFAKSYSGEGVNGDHGRAAIDRATKSASMACIVSDKNDMEIIRIDGPRQVVRRFRKVYGV